MCSVLVNLVIVFLSGSPVTLLEVHLSDDEKNSRCLYKKTVRDGGAGERWGGGGGRVRGCK